MPIKPLNKYAYLRVSPIVHAEVLAIAEQEQRTIVTVTNRLLRNALNEYNEGQ